MLIAAIDPGPEQSALVVWDREEKKLHRMLQAPNGDVLRELGPDGFLGGLLVIEWIKSYGMSVGQPVFDTCRWIGRFQERWEGRGNDCAFITNVDVRLALCNSPRAGESNIRRALQDRYGAKGTKKAPGVLYGISEHLWSALAVAVAWSDLHP